MKNLGLLVLLLAGLALALTYFGWVFSILWGWFVVPVFEIREIAIPEAIGLSLIINPIKVRYNTEDITKAEDKWNRLVFVIVAPAMSLLFGYITLQFI